MKRTRKLILALVVVMSLLMAMAVAIIPASAANEQPEYLFLKTNSNWEQSSPRFAAYFFGNGETWVDMVKTTNGYYAVKVPTDKVYPNVIFCRMNPNASANNWNNKWNQTADLTIPTNGTNLYTVKTGTWDAGDGSWSKGACEKVGHIFKGGKCTACGFAGVVFLKPNSNWLVDNARFAINLCNGASNAWVSMTDNGDDLYTATIPDGNYTNIIFVRMNPSTTANNWTNKWNQTADLLLSGNNNLFTVPSGSWDGATTTWSHYCYGGTATCTEKAVCTVCDEEYGEALGHNMITDAAVAPDCLNTGLTEGSHCSRCDHKVAQTVVPALGHNHEACPHKAVVGDTYYESIKDAIDNAESGTVTLVNDVTYEGTLAITNKNIVIDLNGNNLVADGIVTFGYGVQIIDSGATKGLIDVDPEKLVFAPLVDEETGEKTPATSTDIVPVWNGEGYVIADVTDRYVEVDSDAADKFIIDFKPKFDGVAHSYVKGGETATGLTFEVRITGGDFDKTYTVEDSLIAEAYNGNSVRLNLINAKEGVTYTVQLIIKSECGLHYVGELGQYTYTVPADAE